MMLILFAAASLVGGGVVGLDMAVQSEIHGFQVC